MRNIVAKLPSEAVPEVKAQIDAVYQAPTYDLIPNLFRFCA
jgi:hypothetical protein